MSFDNPEVLSIRRYKAGYEVRTSISDFGGKGEFEVKMAYTSSGDYIGSSKTAYRLCNKRGIAPEKISPYHNVCSIGWCQKEGKWYGWSYRAMYGFKVGSTCKPGDCHYTSSTPEELIIDMGEFYGDISDEVAQKHMDKCEILPDRSGIRVRPTPIMVHAEVSMGDIDKLPEIIDAIDPGNEPAISINSDEESYVIGCGRGEWTAETLDDAKQMAIDFAKGVS